MGHVVRKPVWMVMLLVLVAVVFAGCLHARRDTIVRYDAAADRFAVLNVYRGLHGDDAADMDYLQTLWKERERIYNVPVLTGFALFDQPALQRREDGKFQVINLGQAKEPTPWDLPVSLETLKVVPGKLFVEDELLCYYDQVIVPGKLVDELLPHATRAVTPMLRDFDEELAIRENGGEAAAWDRLRAELREQPKGEAAVALHQVLSTESLKLLKAKIEDGSLRVTRQKQEFTVTIPLSEGDVKEAAATLELWDAQAREKKEDQTLAAYLRAVKWEAVAGGIKVTADPVKLYASLDAFGRYEPSEEERSKSKAAALAMEARAVPVERPTRVAEMAERFAKGTLGEGR